MAEDDIDNGQPASANNAEKDIIGDNEESESDNKEKGTEEGIDSSLKSNPDLVTTEPDLVAANADETAASKDEAKEGTNEEGDSNLNKIFDETPVEGANVSDKKEDVSSEDKDEKADTSETHDASAAKNLPPGEASRDAASTEKEEETVENKEPNQAIFANKEGQENEPDVSESKTVETSTHVSASDSTDIHSKEEIRRAGSLLDDDEEYGEPSDDKPNNANDNENPPASDAPAPPSAEEVSNLSIERTPTTETASTEKTQTPSKGAQILMNRFSSWRKKTNQTMSRSAQNVLNSPVGQSLTNQARTSLFPIIGGAGKTVKGDGENANKDGDEKSGSFSGSSSLEEEGSASESDTTNGTSLDESSRRQEGTDEDRSLMEDSSVMTDETPLDQQQRVAGARLAVQAAATGIVDSVASGFRGRYASGTESATDTTPIRKGRSLASMTQSQTALIMKSRAATHMQSILDSLAPYEYVMLLGTGMLGVNLRQTYLKNNGVYMDYFLPGGAAESSGVVFIGDVLVKVGEIDVQKGTIHNVPQTIATARRPVVLVFSTGMNVGLERVNYIDVAVAMMHKIRDESKQRVIASMPLLADADKSTHDEAGEDGNENATKRDTTPEHFAAEPMALVPDVDIPTHSFVKSNIMNPPLPPLKARELLAPHVPKRCNDKFSVSMLTHAATSSESFRAALRGAFLCSTLDGRRLPFLAAHLSSEEFYDTETLPQKAGDQAPQTLASKQLMLFLELVSFVDLYDVTPASRHRDIAKRIAYKFFLPEAVGNRLEPPMFDFHHIVPDSNLRELEQALNDAQRPIDRDLFVHFQEAVVDLLAGPTFVSFLVSDECSRMRAYLRNTAPYVNVSIREVFEHVIGKETGVDGNAKRAVAHNHFLYMLMHLLCLTENEFGTENDDLRVGMSNNRVIGLAGGIACAIFIKRDLSLCLQNAKGLLEADSDLSSESCIGQICTLVQAFNHLWEAFVAPGGGALDCFSCSSETSAALDTVRGLLNKAVSRPNEALSKVDRDRLLIQTLLNSELSEALNRLSEELLFDYAINTYPKYREHKFHEWMCSEVSKVHADEEEETKECEVVLPRISDGCIKRLFRKLDLPVGVSSHKQIRSERRTPPSHGTNVSDPRGDTDPHVADGTDPSSNKLSNPNADYAIVFGTDDGLNAAGHIPNPTMNKDDVRRYVCQAVPVGCKNQVAVTLDEKSIPPTLESYATVPAFRNKPFSRVVDNSRVSADGWEISLVNFMIPNADVSSQAGQNGSVYGVALSFQKTDEAARSYSESNAVSTPIEFAHTKQPLDEISTSDTSQKKKGTDGDCKDSLVTPLASKQAADDEVVFDSNGNSIDVGAFASPISFFSPLKKSTAIEESPATVKSPKMVRHIQVNKETPKFNRRLCERSWLERVMDFRKSTSQSGTISVGIALISGNNNVMAMRNTLSRLLFDHARTSGAENETSQDMGFASGMPLFCGPLVDILGNFSHKDVESVALKCILEPYLRFASSPWIQQPLRNQATEYCDLAGEQLIKTLPPIPLALLFVTVLLEQKIVLSSSRRSILFAAASSITELLHPLKWSHLLVPLVPSALAKDLVQYPAPFILGIPSEDPGNMDLLNTLPDDVTLVDLDVGRVILAPSFAYDDALLRVNEDEAVTARALRSQALYLAQSLGVLFGSRMHDQTWCSDSPLVALSYNRSDRNEAHGSSNFQKLRNICRGFLSEILSGSPSCCYWIEEQRLSEKSSLGDVSSEVECTVLFDEDRFFHLKNLRAEGRASPLLANEEYRASDVEGRLQEDTGLALSLDNFDLILESFLRCQSMSTFISSIPKEKMVYY